MNDPLALLLTTQEAADVLRVTDETIRRWCRTGRLATVRVGRRHLINRADLDALVETPTPAPAPAPAPVDSFPFVPRAETSAQPRYSPPDPVAYLTPRIIGDPA